MEKNTFIAILLSMLFLIVWWTYLQPPAAQKPAQNTAPAPQQAVPPSRPQAETMAPAPPAALPAMPEKEITVETDDYKAIFTTRGAAVKHWFLKEKNGTLVDLVLDRRTPVMSTFPGADFAVRREDPRKLLFTWTSPLGWQVKKTYDLSADFLHNLTIEITKTKPSAAQPPVQVDWGPGLGTDEREQAENTGLTRVLGFTLSKPRELKKFKPGDYPAQDLQWLALDNRYFLVAFIPKEPGQFDTATAYRGDKKDPLGVTLSAGRPADAPTQTYALQFYLGPKGYSHLKTLQLNLDKAVDFGFFGFLGQLALDVLLFLYKATGNYGWAIILLTIILQIIVFPLTMKSLKASAAMKRLQPLMRQIQEKYKGDPKRLNAEMLNLYRTEKINPVSGCLPMLLQLPIFWALFTTLRNAYELRGAPWILWVRDLSAPDQLMTLGSFSVNMLPLIMGIGMFFQQKMMSVSTDPMQARIMYLMPVMFTFMFWGFPSGLVIYWLTNSIMAMIEQYFVMRRQSEVTYHG